MTTKLTFSDLSQNAIRYGCGQFYDEDKEIAKEKTAAWKELDSTVCDVMLAQSMLRPYFYDRSDWLGALRNISERNRQEALHYVVGSRILDPNAPLPFSLVFACEYAMEQGWEVPEQWIQLIRAAVHISDLGYNPIFPSFKDKAKEFLATMQVAAATV